MLARGNTRNVQRESLFKSRYPFRSSTKKRVSRGDVKGSKTKLIAQLRAEIKEKERTIQELENELIDAGLRPKNQKRKEEPLTRPMSVSSSPTFLVADRKPKKSRKRSPSRSMRFRHQFRCPDCDFKANREGDLARHVCAQHTKPSSFTCPICGFSTKQSLCLIRHMRAVHSQCPQKFSCPHCACNTCRAIDLTRHIRAVHFKERAFKCPNCPFSASLKGDLARHICAVHSKTFSCTICDYTTTVKKNLSRHVRIFHKYHPPWCQ